LMGGRCGYATLPSACLPDCLPSLFTRSESDLDLAACAVVAVLVGAGQYMQVMQRISVVESVYHHHHHELFTYLFIHSLLALLHSN
jgi:hypothetical protein